jgi:UDP-N-acetylmuramate dehydrogenase
LNLQTFNTLGIAARADTLVSLTHLDHLAALSPHLRQQPRFILGRGSNVVFTAPVRATVLVNQLHGKSINAAGVLTCAGGEDWHQVVMWSLAQGYAGLENLALIPGTMGAAPIQNIGAYGVELSDSLLGLTAWDFTTQSFKEFSRDDCQFAYRESVFKNPQIQGPWDSPRYLITQVRLQLTPIAKATLKTDYGDLQSELAGVAQQSKGPLTALDVANAVIAIRSRKLPDPNQIGNVGSFFKNPIVSAMQAKSLSLLHPDLPQYPADLLSDTACKLSAAWMIDRCGFKGARRGDVGVHERHALVLVNHGGGTGRELIALAQEIQQAVVAKFGVFLEPEPVMVPPAMVGSNS